MLNKNVKTHYILIKEGERNQIKKISITKAQYELYEQELQMKKHNEFFKIHDIDTQEILFNGRANKIEGFEEKKQDTSLQEKRVVCDYGTRHNIQGYPNNCDCKKEFDCFSFQFKDWLIEAGHIIQYASDITKYMQEQFKNRNK